ncbi:JmjC domain-containing protein [Benzoatithermus flavus]|uniref:Cupin domain-containing protein n=1 Tax=Benzoatithermus flavus TaxID=3108223 RepID=A0ABU8XKV3_9PROT
MTFDDILAPLGAEAFLRDYLGQQPLHLQGPPEKFRDVMNWDVLNRLLGMTTIWAAPSMLLVLDKEQIQPPAYCQPAPGRDGGTVLRPDPARVKQFLAKGATLVLNDIDQLTPELSAVSRAMEQALGGKVQANLYLSSKRKQAFKAHYDYHDVFAMHVMGEKTWMVFQGREDGPIKHPWFEALTQDYKDKAKGELWREVRLEPGHLLYLPRGQYHYALADDGACAHIAFGVTYPIGMDAVSYAFERMVHESIGRANLPRDRAALKERLEAIGRTIARCLAEDRAVDDMLRFMAGFHWPRDSYDLPDLIEKADEAYRVKGAGVRLVSQGGRHGLVKGGSRQAVEVPAEVQAQVAWVLAHERFTRRGLLAAFPAEPPAKLDKLLLDLARMGLLEPVA